MSEVMAEHQDERIPTILLVGRSGNGKSSVRNSILGEHFNEDSVFQFGENLRNVVSTNAEFKVVDCTGIGDMGSDRSSDIQSVIEAAEAVFSQGFDALTFVLKYGVRFTKQDRDAVQMIKSVFGENVFKYWGILVFSYGDNFYQDAEDDIKFEDWCRKQTGYIKNLFEEICYRCVVFDNKTRDKEKQRKQREKLMECVERMRNEKFVCYSLSDYENAKCGREPFMVQEEFKSLKRETDTIIKETNRIIKLTLSDPDNQLKTLLDELLSHNRILEKKDRNTGLLKSLQSQVQEQITILQNMTLKLKQMNHPVQALMEEFYRKPWTTFIMCSKHLYENFVRDSQHGKPV